MKLKTFGLALATSAFINISHAQSALSLDTLPVVGDLLGGGSLLNGLDLAGLPLGLGGADAGGLGGLTAGLPLDGLPVASLLDGGLPLNGLPTGALLGGGLGGNPLMGGGLGGNPLMGGGIPLVGGALAGTPLGLLALPVNLVLMGTLGSVTGGGLPLPI